MALNTAFMRDGVVLKLADGVEFARPVQVLHLVDAGSVALAVHPRTLVVAGDNSTATIVEILLAAWTPPTGPMP